MRDDGRAALEALIAGDVRPLTAESDRIGHNFAALHPRISLVDLPDGDIEAVRSFQVRLDVQLDRPVAHGATPEGTGSGRVDGP